MHRLHLDFHKIHIIKSELQEVYLNLVMERFAISLISIFVPIYLLKLGYSLNQALLFVAFEIGILSLFSPISALLAKRFGFKHIILYRMPLLLTYFAGLLALNSVKLPIYPIAMIGGIAGSMYWVSLHSLFAKHSDKLHRGAQAGKLISMPQIAALFGPSIGGLIALSFGFSVLIIIAMALVVFSVSPLFFTGDMRPHVVRFSLKDVFARKHLRFIFTFVVQGTMAIATVVVWPLFVYFTLDDVVSVGFMATIAAVGTILFILYIGRMSDRVNRLALLKIGGILLALTFFMRIYATTTPKVFAVSFLAGLFIVLIDLPILTSFYDAANRENTTEVVILREIGLGIGKVSALLILLLVVNKFTVGLSIGGIASLVLGLF